MRASKRPLTQTRKCWCNQGAVGVGQHQFRPARALLAAQHLDGFLLPALELETELASTTGAIRRLEHGLHRLADFQHGWSCRRRLRSRRSLGKLWPESVHAAPFSSLRLIVQWKMR